jgi:esterase/lipase superfamily enzyme
VISRFLRSRSHCTYEGLIERHPNRVIPLADGDWWGIALIGRFRILTAAAIASAICCSGCSGRLSQRALVSVAQADTEGTSRVPVLVATKRNRSTTNVGEMFGSERAEEVSYASVTVSIPPDSARKIGEVQWPTSLPGDPRQSFVTASADYLDKQSFAAALSAAAKKTGRGKVLVFVHGFNNRFDEAVYRFAQIVHDSKAPAIPVLFSWPSRGVEALHSRALRAGKIGDKVKNVLLVAPDVDINLFRTQMREMGSGRPRFSLFLSQDDGALKLSKSISGGVTRLGDVDPDQEPYKSDFQREGILVFDLTNLRGGAHSRAFEKVTSVMGIIEQRLAEGQQMTPNGSGPEAASQ